MTTAIASPPSVQSAHSRDGWPNGSTDQVNLNSMSSEDISWMFVPRKSAQRQNSSSSLSSNSSAGTISTTPQPHTNGIPNGEQSWGTRKKPARGLWPSSKAEPVSGISVARPQSVAAASSGTSAASAISALHTPQNVLPSQHMVQPQSQTNGVAREPAHQESPVLLHLLPMNGTFERKTITVPLEPHLVKIGRQTNQKTLPTPLNGYFDSKVLSRAHAEIWADKDGKINIRDVKSSNGTFVNGKRLSQENQSSEAHMLKEQDVLELGIDIVSEDQKQVIHHKVAARVEYAGFYAQSNGSLDPIFGELENQTANGHGPLHGGQGFRSRNSSTGASTSTSRFGHVVNASAGVAPHHPKWLQPITMEQVVKRLHAELRQARLQSQDLQHTSTFVDAVLANEKPPPMPQQQKISSPVRPEIKSRFSAEPPAPPPSQPLPEKPDVAPWSTLQDLPVIQPLLRRSDTEKPRTPHTGSNSSSPTKTDAAHQIMSLMEALAAAQKEISSQSGRLTELDSALRREREARNIAEEKTKRLQPAASPVDSAGISGDAEDEITQESPPDLQQRFDIMHAEMDQMKVQVESYRQRAESAESESQRDRKSLAEMVESIRRRDEAVEAGRKRKAQRRDARRQDDKGPAMQNDGVREVDDVDFDDDVEENLNDSNGPATTTELSKHVQTNHDRQINGSAVTSMSDSQLKQLSDAVSAAAESIQSGNGYRTMQASRTQERLVQSAPYASIMGVVLLGVGMMAYLNGWQRVAER
ncbi:MAG: hypothetical protein M1828_001990 [Chrysothrix sp. TS-e1954]|nr:MAG: hypothetical protein M1828_001990 [Chrysothrix sp. TS-e1954]